MVNCCVNIGPATGGPAGPCPTPMCIGTCTLTHVYMWTQVDVSNLGHFQMALASLIPYVHVVTEVSLVQGIWDNTNVSFALIK